MKMEKNGFVIVKKLKISHFVMDLIINELKILNKIFLK